MISTRAPGAVVDRRPAAYRTDYSPVGCLAKACLSLALLLERDALAAAAQRGNERRNQ